MSSLGKQSLIATPFSALPMDVFAIHVASYRPEDDSLLSTVSEFNTRHTEVVCHTSTGLMCRPP